MGVERSAIQTYPWKTVSAISRSVSSGTAAGRPVGGSHQIKLPAGPADRPAPRPTSASDPHRLSLAALPDTRNGLWKRDCSSAGGSLGETRVSVPGPATRRGQAPAGARRACDRDNWTCATVGDILDDEQGTDSAATAPRSVWPRWMATARRGCSVPGGSSAPERYARSDPADPSPGV